MNFRTTLVLLLLLAAAGAYFAFVSLKAPTTEQVQEQRTQSQSPDGSPVFEKELSSDDVATVTVENAHGKAVIVREGKDWKQTEPVVFAMNEWSVKDAVDTAAKLRYTEKFTPGKGNDPTVEQLALAPPRATLTITTASDQPVTHTFRLGRTRAGRGFVMVDDNPQVYVTLDSLHANVVDKNVADWRKRTLATPGPTQANRVRLQYGKQTVELVKADNAWSFSAGASGRAGDAKVAEVLNALGGVYIDKFVADQPEDLSVFGLDRPLAVVTVATPAATADGKTTDEEVDAPPAAEPAVRGGTLWVGSPVDLQQEQYFATWSEGENPAKVAVVFTIGKATVDKFNVDVDGLRDDRVSTLATANVRQATITRSTGETINLTKEPSGWTFGEPKPPFSADGAQVESLLDTIAAARATGYEADAKPRSEPIATISLTAIGRTEPEVVKLFAAGEAGAQSADESAYLALRNNETTGYLVPREQVKSVFEPVMALRDRVAVDLRRVRVGRLTIQRPDMTMSFEREAGKAESAEPTPTAGEPEPGPWKMAGQERFESAALEQLLDQLTPVRAERWLPQEQAPAAQAYTVTAETFDGRKTTITVDPATRIATATGVQGAFVLAEPLVTGLGQEMRYRTVLPIELENLATVIISSEGRSVGVTRSAGRYTGASGEDLDEANAAAVFDTLAGLRAERLLDPAAVTLSTKASHTLVIRDKNGQEHTLALWPAGATELGVPVGRLNGDKLVFSLSDETFTKLTTDPLKRADGPPTPLAPPPAFDFGGVGEE